MFSKQADARSKKASGKKTRNQQPQQQQCPKKGKSRKSRRDQQQSKQAESGPDLIEGLKQAEPIDDNVKSVDLVVIRDREVDVPKKQNCVKRYSDSFVLADDSDAAPKLARAVSGFILAEEEKLERKTRRFSDLFRYGALKSYNSCDNLKMGSKVEEQVADELDGVVLRHPQKLDAVKKEPKKKDEPPLTNTNNSYLKRVRSKIYKNKSDSIAGPTMPDISENAVKTKKNKNKKNAEIKSKTESTDECTEMRKPFEFRLIRQTSNLERIRPRSFAPKKCSSNSGIAEMADNKSAGQEKPVLVKSKSSSAISLNLLRTRRNKILEQVKNRNCEVVENEFDFIPFGNGIRSSQRLYGSQTLNTLNNNVTEVPECPAWMNGSQGKLRRDERDVSLGSVNSEVL